MTDFKDAYRVVPGAVYVLESTQRMSQADAEMVKQRFAEATGATAVIICPPLRLVPTADGATP